MIQSLNADLAVLAVLHGVRYFNIAFLAEEDAFSIDCFVYWSIRWPKVSWLLGLFI